MQTDPAWNYAERTRDPRHVGRIRSELQSAVHMTERELRHIDDVLAQLERAANRPPRPSRAGRRRPPLSDLQGEFPF